FIVGILARVYEHMIDMLIEEPNNARQPNDFGSGAEDGHYFELRHCYAGNREQRSRNQEGRHRLFIHICSSWYFLKKRVRVGRLEDFIAPEHGEQILAADVFDLVRTEGRNRDKLGRRTGDVKLADSIFAHATDANDGLAADHTKPFHFAAMKMV